MAPHMANDFDFKGFYDGSPHVTILPVERPYEVIAHEATHAIITTLSGCGFMQQIAGHLRHLGDTLYCPYAKERAAEINGIVDRSSLIVHETVAWLVSQLARNHDIKCQMNPGLAAHHVEQLVGVPARYDAEVLRLRASLEAIPEKPYDSLNECLDDFDPIFLSPSRLAIALASYALSPPHLEQLIIDPKPLFADRLRELLSGEQSPLHRFQVMQKRLSSTPFAQAKEWSKWVWRWQYGKQEPCPITLSALQCRTETSVDNHSGYLARAISDSALVEFIFEVCDRRIPRSALEEIDWEAMRRDCRFEPHVASHFQTCVISRPRIEQDLYLQDAVPSDLVTSTLDCVNIAVGEEINFQFERFRKDAIQVRFGPSFKGRNIVWSTATPVASTYLQRWAKLGKGIVTSSTDYDFSIGDFRKFDLLRCIPHVVVAITDLRTLWTRLTNKRYGGFKQTRRFQALLITSSEAPELYGFLIIKGEAPFPLIVTPVLVRSGQYIHSIIDELRTPGFQIQEVSHKKINEFMGVCRPSMEAAMYFLRDHFSADDNKPVISKREAILLEIARKAGSINRFFREFLELGRRSK